VGAAPRRIQYVVVPHPDDEFQAWSLIEGTTDRYTVFVLLTHGEASGMLDGHGFDAAKGERTPQPQPFHGRHSTFGRAQRLDSWHAFLDAMADEDPATLDVPTFHGHLDTSRGGVDVFIGEGTARVVFDLGDGRLDQDAVADATTIVRTQVRPLLPHQEEADVIGASYFNASDDAAPIYTHRDHRAVHEALWNVDLGVPGRQRCRTTHGDPDVVAATGGTTRAISPETYEAMMALGPDDRRQGHYQRIYGWLAFFDGGAFPPAPDEHEDGAVSRYQSFWHRF
jgi:hypothetical protein